MFQLSTPEFLSLALGIPALLFIIWTFRGKYLTSKAHSAKASPEPPSNEVCTTLALSLPGCVFFQHQPEFSTSLGSYWSKQNREIVPVCVVKPRNDAEVSTALKILKKDYDRSINANEDLTVFAIRSGGHSTIPGASNASEGIVIDLSLLDQVLLSEDGKTVCIGCGARWGDVSRKLDPLGLAVAGGRNSDVGVGGLTLGGGYSYFSPQHGFVCDNTLEFNVILASGEITVASEQQNPQLWRALQGGGNNFAIVTRFKMRCFPCSKVWSGFLYMWSWKAPQVIRAFNNFVDGSFDQHAAGPLLCISYVQQIGITLIATHLMYTKPESWPHCWGGFKSIGRIWSSTKVRTLTNATDELDSISPAGFRQLHISTTIKNDLATLEFAYSTFKSNSALLKRVKGMVWTLVFQPLHMSTMSQGKNNVLGLSDRRENLVIVLFTAVWERQLDDHLVNNTADAALGSIDEFASSNGSADSFRYLNWCDKNAHPFEGYGAMNLDFLRHASRTYDPDGLFQRGCIGGFKLKDGAT